MTNTGFEISDWRVSDREHRKGVAKRAVYSVLRPFLSARAARHLSHSFRREIRPDAFYFSRGTPEEWRRRWGARHVTLSDATILVQGTGTGWDALAWAEMKPRRLVATDLYAFDNSWEQIAAECRERFGVTVEFRQAALEDHGFLEAGAVDLCASAAVLEHCRDLNSVLAESMRLLRPGGSFYAAYGPLWYGPGGDHFSGRDGQESIYNHIGLDEDAYGAYVKAHLQPREDFQSGGRYVELDLFSRLATRGYLAAFEEAGFVRDALVVELSPDALSYRERFPERWRALLARLDGQCDEDDLIIKANFVRLLKPGG
jgi:SAM-dependent methyltransferase